MKKSHTAGQVTKAKLAGSLLLTEGILIEKEKSLFVCVSADRKVYLPSLKPSRINSIYELVADSSITWNEAKTYGWKCIKVDVTFNACR